MSPPGVGLQQGTKEEMSEAGLSLPSWVNKGGRRRRLVVHKSWTGALGSQAMDAMCVPGVNLL